MSTGKLGKGTMEKQEIGGRKMGNENNMTERSSFRKLTSLMVVIAVGTFTGCSVNSKKDLPSDLPSDAVAELPADNTVAGPSSTGGVISDFSRTRLISTDFVSTLSRIPATNPANTILRTSNPSSRFGELLLGSLQQAGYDLRVGVEGSENWLAWEGSLDAAPSNAGNPTYTFIVAAGPVKLKRTYEVLEDGIWPASAMFIKGADASAIAVDDSIFGERPKPRPLQQPETLTIANQTNENQAIENKAVESLARQQVEPATVAKAVPTPEPALTQQTDNLPISQQSAQQSAQQVTQQASAQPQPAVVLSAVPTPKPIKTSEIVRRPTAAASLSDSLAGSLANKQQQENPVVLAPALKLPPRETQIENKAPGNYSEFSNMYESRESRYEDLFQEYGVVESQVLLFSSDDLILGKQNKRAIKRQLTNFNPDTDLISVIGCSHGETKLKSENANGYLANARAFRVKEEFVSAGLSADLVLEEGCWANEEFAQMPARGVVIQHKRLLN